MEVRAGEEGLCNPSILGRSHSDPGGAWQRLKCPGRREKVRSVLLPGGWARFLSSWGYLVPCSHFRKNNPQVEVENRKTG